MPYTKNLVIFSLFSFLLTISISTGYAVTLADYELAVSQKQKFFVRGISKSLTRNSMFHNNILRGAE